LAQDLGGGGGVTGPVSGESVAKLAAPKPVKKAKAKRKRRR